jgi:hypothetical protein
VSGVLVVLLRWRHWLPSGIGALAGGAIWREGGLEGLPLRFWAYGRMGW